MHYLLDTCVLSEFSRQKPEQKVIRWIEQMDEEQLFICSITIGEIQRGIERLTDSQRKTALLTWLANDLVERFGPRVLPIDCPTMLPWGSLSARLDASGRPLPVMDSLIAACALQHNLVLVTRNTADFAVTGVSLINPWG